MNKEEFKATINQQLRDPKSPLRAILLATSHENVNGVGQDAFCQDEQFFASDFGLSFVAEYVAPHPTRAREPIFQVKFIEMWPGFKIFPDFERLDLCSPQFKERKWCIEDVRFSKNEIQLWQTRFSLAETDYLYRYEGFEEEKIASFDITLLRFVPRCTEWNIFVSIHRAEEKATDYVKYKFNQSDDEALGTLCKTHSVDIVPEGKLLSLFRNLHHPTSIHRRLVEGLQDVRGKLPLEE